MFLGIYHFKRKLSGIVIVFGIMFFCITAFIAVDNGKTSNLIIPNDNAAVDKEQIEIFLGRAESKRVIEVDVKSIASGEGVNLGQYKLEEGDMIVYNITSEGKGNLNIFFMKIDEYDRGGGYLG
ncbi:hypothetical protein [Sporosarcina sp. FSL K6-3457]|uniref:hypothetical protein n=1 Tax=Sporosarcina sp. FSL K6-3457 TaxID=2978204 RepID=UPI0030FBAC31